MIESHQDAAPVKSFLQLVDDLLIEIENAEAEYKYPSFIPVIERLVFLEQSEARVKILQQRMNRINNDKLPRD